MARLSELFRSPTGRMLTLSGAAGLSSNFQGMGRSPGERERGPGPAGMRRGPFAGNKRRGNISALGDMLKDLNRGEPKPGTRGEPKARKKGAPAALREERMEPDFWHQAAKAPGEDDFINETRERLSDYWPEHVKAQLRGEARRVYGGLRAVGQEGEVEMHNLLGRRVVGPDGVVRAVTHRGLIPIGRISRKQMDGLRRTVSWASRERYAALSANPARPGGFGAWSSAVDARMRGGQQGRTFRRHELQ